MISHILIERTVVNRKGIGMKGLIKPSLYHVGLSVVLFVFGLVPLIASSTSVIRMVGNICLLAALSLAYCFLMSSVMDISKASFRYRLMYIVMLGIGYIPSLFLKELNPFVLTWLLGIAFITVLTTTQIALITHVVGINVLLVATDMTVNIYLFYLLAGLTVIILMPYALKRQKMTQGTIIATLIFIGLYVVQELSFIGSFDLVEPISILIVALHAVLVIFLTQGSIPVWETLFGIVSDEQLKLYADSNQPLIQRLMMEAPGTYHHSMMVANLSEKAASQLEANPILARVGALYHDIGKLENPLYFIENQSDENIHDELAPDASATYIIRHVETGVQMAKEAELPKCIIDIIKNHHGDSIVSYFYQRAKDHSDGFDIDVSGFKYNGPRPDTIEASIVMLADCTEAAVKGIPEKERDMQVIKEKIHQVIQAVMMKDQLSESLMQLKDLNTVEKAFESVYKGMYHERIQYERE